MKISAKINKDILNRMREFPSRANNAVWNATRQLRDQLIDELELNVPTAMFHDSTRQEPLADFLISRVKMIRNGPNEWEVGVFGSDGIEYFIITIHEFGGKIKVTPAMVKWWNIEFKQPLTKSYIDIDELGIIRSVLEDIPDFEAPSI